MNYLITILSVAAVGSPPSTAVNVLAIFARSQQDYLPFCQILAKRFEGAAAGKFTFSCNDVPFDSNAEAMPLAAAEASYQPLEMPIVATAHVIGADGKKLELDMFAVWRIEPVLPAGIASALCSAMVGAVPTVHYTCAPANKNP